MSKKTKIILGVIVAFIFISVGLVIYLSSQIKESDPRFQQLMRGVDKNSTGLVAKSSVDISLMPMYGGVEKTAEQKKADEEFVSSVIKAAGSKEKASTEAVTRAKDLLRKGDLDMAMKRYNQAWLLDSNNPEAYIGFGDILKKQGHEKEAAEMYKKAGEFKE